MLELIRVKRTEPRLLLNMADHYSQPNGFVGRNICYAVMFNSVYYGGIVGCSATKHLAGRNEYFGHTKETIPLNNIVNNIFYHIEPVTGKYPTRNFAMKVLSQFQKQIAEEWEHDYGDKVIGFETLVELPIKGEIYLRSGWDEIGQTIGYTCKRVAGQGTDNWTGKRVWNTTDLRPKRVFAQKIL